MHLKSGWKRIFDERLSSCVLCQQQISCDNMKSTCRICFGQFHKICLQNAESLKFSTSFNYIVCSNCEKSCETSLDLTYTTLSFSQLRIPYESVPSATNRLLSEATQYSMRRNSWTWSATLDELKAQTECLSKMPSLGERMRLKQTRSYSDSRISFRAEYSENTSSNNLTIAGENEITSLENQDESILQSNVESLEFQNSTDESFRKTSFPNKATDSGVSSYCSMD